MVACLTSTVCLRNVKTIHFIQQNTTVASKKYKVLRKGTEQHDVIRANIEEGNNVVSSIMKVLIDYHNFWKHFRIFSRTTLLVYRNIISCKIVYCCSLMTFAITKPQSHECTSWLPSKRSKALTQTSTKTRWCSSVLSNFKTRTEARINNGAIDSRGCLQKRLKTSANLRLFPKSFLTWNKRQHFTFSY